MNYSEINKAFSQAVSAKLAEGLHLHATHNIYEVNDCVLSDFNIKVGNSIPSIPKENFSEFLKKYNGKKVGVRLGWTGWQIGLDNNDKKRFIKMLGI